MSSAHQGQVAKSVPMSEWGKDHFSVLIYLYHCANERDGKVSRPHMRTGEHNRLYAMGSQSLSNRPTRTKNGELVSHDDWDCIDDMIDAGLGDWTTSHKPQSFDDHPCFSLYTEGWDLARRMIAHIEAGNHSSSFIL